MPFSLCKIKFIEEFFGKCLVQHTILYYFCNYIYNKVYVPLELVNQAFIKINKCHEQSSEGIWDIGKEKYSNI